MILAIIGKFIASHIDKEKIVIDVELPESLAYVINNNEVAYVSYISIF